MFHHKWKALAITVATLVVVVLGARLLILWHGERAVRRAIDRFETEVWSLDLMSHALDKVEGRYNAAHWAQAGATVETLTDDQATLLDRVSRLEAAGWTAEDRRRIAEVVAENEIALDLLHRAAPLEQSSFELDYRAGMEMVIPDLSKTLKASRLLLAELRLAVLDERPDGAALAARSLRSLARACQRESLVIFQLVGLALERQFWEGARELVSRGLGDAGLLADFRRPLREIDMATQFRRSVAVEAALLLWPQREVYLLKNHHDAAALEYYAAFAKLSPDGLAEAPRQPRKPPIVASFSSIASKFKATQALRELAGVALGVALEGRRNGAYPADLSAFPEAASNVYTGRPVEYRLESDGSAVLSVPGAAELWQSQNPDVQRGPPPFSWRLPPLP